MTLHDRATGVVRFVGAQFDRLGVRAEDRPNFIQRFVELDANGRVWKDKVYEVLVDEFELRGTPSAETLVEDYLANYPSCAVEFPGVTDALNFLRDSQFKLCILTNGRTDLQHNVIDALGFRSLVDAVVVSQEVGLRKPDPQRP